MKKNLLTFILTIFLTVIGFAQRNNIAPEIQAARDMKAIENNMLKENTDEEGVKLIKEHNAAKKRLDGNMRKLPGYGKAATDKGKLEKFREKNASKDPEFKKISDKEIATLKAKEEYIANANEEYNKLRQIRSK